ncbi:hypothetical protein MTO96_002423 [Rhipicephalus appendiculatus]
MNPESAFESGYGIADQSAYGTSIQQSNYAYSTAVKSSVGTQSQLSTVSNTLYADYTNSHTADNHQKVDFEYNNPQEAANYHKDDNQTNDNPQEAANYHKDDNQTNDNHDAANYHKDDNHDPANYHKDDNQKHDNHDAANYHKDDNQKHDNHDPANYHKDVNQKHDNHDAANYHKDDNQKHDNHDAANYHKDDNQKHDNHDAANYHKDDNQKHDNHDPANYHKNDNQKHDNHDPANYHKDDNQKHDNHDPADNHKTHPDDHETNAIRSGPAFAPLYLHLTARTPLSGGLGGLELTGQYFLGLQARFTKSKFGFSISPRAPPYQQDSKHPQFWIDLDDIYVKYKIIHFGCLDLYKQYAERAKVTEALNILKALYLHLKPKTTSANPSYYVIGLSLDDPAASTQILNLMKTVFTPSMFIAISHLSYPVRKFSDCRIFPVAVETLPPNLVRGKDYTYGHTVHESLAVLQEVEKLGLSIPLGISFSLKGVYYTPKIANPSPEPAKFPLYEPCKDHQKPYYDDPSALCNNRKWTPRNPLPIIAYNPDEKRAITYLTENSISQLACDGKQLNMNLKFALAAYDAEFDSMPPCLYLVKKNPKDHSNMTMLALAVVMTLLDSKSLAVNYTREVANISMLCAGNNLYMVGASTNFIDPNKVRCVRSPFIAKHQRGCRRFVELEKNFATAEHPWWSPLKYTISIYTWNTTSGLHCFRIDYPGAVLPVGIRTDYAVLHANDYCLITGECPKKGEKTICSYWVKPQKVEQRDKVYLALRRTPVSSLTGGWSSSTADPKGPVATGSSEGVLDVLSAFGAGDKDHGAAGFGPGDNSEWSLSCRRPLCGSPEYGSFHAFSGCTAAASSQSSSYASVTFAKILLGL